MSEHIQEFTLDNNEQSLKTESHMITVSDILKRIDDVIVNTQYLKDALESIKGCPDGRMGIGVGNMVEQREKTNQQIITLLERMYDDMSKQNNPQLVDTKAEIIKNVMNQAFEYEVENVGDYTNAVKEMLSDL